MDYKAKEESATAELTKIAEDQACKEADVLEVKHSLPMSRKLYVENKTAQYLNELKKELAKLLVQMNKVSVVINEKLQNLPDIERNVYAKELTLAVEILNNQDIDSAKFEEAGSLQKIVKLSNETLLWIYRIGAQFFEEKKFEDSICFFRFLVILNPNVCDYWIALGTAQQAFADKSQALLSFSLAVILEPEHVEARRLCAEANMSLGQFEEAFVEIQALAEIIKKQKLDSLRPLLEELQNKVRVKQSI